VGSSTVPGLLWSYADNTTPDRSDDELMFRIRVGKGAQNSRAYPGNLGQYVWQIFIDSGGFAGSIEWSLQLDNSGNGRVGLVELTTGGPTYADLVFSTSPAWTGSLEGFSRLVDPTGDGIHIGDGPADAFVDFGIPWADFAGAVGLPLHGSFRLGLSSSTSHVTTNKDFPGDLASTSSVATALSDPIGTPEPSTLFLIAVGGGLLLIRRRS
jgi:hypothetical protein